MENSRDRTKKKVLQQVNFQIELKSNNKNINQNQNQ